MIDLTYANFSNNATMIKEYLGMQMQQQCKLPSPEQIFKYVCDKYNSWFIWFIPILFIWYLIIPVIANIIYKFYITKQTETIQKNYAKWYSKIYDSVLFGIIFFGGIIWLYMALQKGYLSFLGMNV